MKIIQDILMTIDVSVVTLGTFDGVHLGHQHLISQTVHKAHELGMPSVVVTFDSHPKAYFGGETLPYKLMTTEEKVSAIAQCGVDYLYIIPFDSSLAQMSPEMFLETYIVGKLGARHFVMGYNHRFGKGNYPPEYYEEICRKHNIGASRVSQWIEDGNICSSSQIREALRQGNITLANKLLGREYALQGKVVHGDAIGRNIGYPTANISLDDTKKIIPQEGVYAAKAKIDNNTYNAAVFVGTRPTIGDTEKRVEVYIMDFSEVIYGNLMTISFVSKKRDVIRFDSLELLKEQISKDVAFLKKGLKKFDF